MLTIKIVCDYFFQNLICQCLLSVVSLRDKEVRGVVLMDKDFTFTHGKKQTGVRNGLLVQNQSRYPIKH